MRKISYDYIGFWKEQKEKEGICTFNYKVNVTEFPATGELKP